MEIVAGFSEIKKIEKAVITIGTFDGVHKGHFDILNTLNQTAKKENVASCVITFDPHPQKVVSKNFELKLLSTLDEKIKLIKEFGVDNVIVIKFDRDLANLTAEEFLQKLIDSGIGIKHIIVGYDHGFGKNRSGNEEQLRILGKKIDFSVTRVGAVKLNEDGISSTKIRRALLDEGDVTKAASYLGRYYNIEGKVVKGARRGRQLGFPTANIDADYPDKLIPKKGVYCISSEINGKKFYGIMNIGMRPTFNDVSNYVIEVHFLDFDFDIYGKKIKVEIIERIRDEVKFETKSELINQITRDKAACRELMKKVTN
ncbi:MAG: bifunctional riboflavin kinase/FAD synthetase [Rhodothermaceae bacterium]